MTFYIIYDYMTYVMLLLAVDVLFACGCVLHAMSFQSTKKTMTRVRVIDITTCFGVNRSANSAGEDQRF